VYPRREQYVRAPLVLVTAELRLNYEPQVKRDDVRDAFATAVRSRFPILANEQVVTFALQTPAEAPVEPEHLPQIRATAKDRTATVALNPTSLNLSMSGDAYGAYEDSFEPLMSAVVDALYAVTESVVIERVGLRLIDEVRPASPPEHTDGWARWINPELIGATAALASRTARGFRSSVVFKPEPDRTVTFSCGEFTGVTIVDQGLPFGRKEGPPSKMFVIDVDSAWEPEGFAMLDPGAITSVLAELHRPVGELFQWSITDEARMMFRGEGENVRD